MSVQTQIDRISGNITAALAAIADKGVTVPDGSTSDALAELIASIEAGGEWISLGSFTLSEDAASFDFISWSDFTNMIGDISSWENVLLIYRAKNLPNKLAAFMGTQIWLALSGSLYSTQKGYCLGLNVSNNPTSVSTSYNAINLSLSSGVQINSQTGNYSLKAGVEYLVEAVVYR